MLLHWFQRLEHTAMGDAITQSTWLYPAIQIVHLLGLTMLLGCVIVTNLRMLDVFVTEVSLGRLTRSLRPMVVSALALTVLSGGLLFLADVMKYYSSILFFWKMGLLASALVLSFVVSPLAQGFGLSASRGGRRILACLSLAAWFGAGIAGRSIAFF